MLHFELLRAFVAVADCGGFHRAAERLNLTQSTISQASVRGAEQTPGEHDVKPSRRSCSGPFDGGDDALGEAAGEGDREISGAGPRSASRWQRQTTIASQKHSASRY
jgi:hypothetical protein